jgi:pimeloyl-ACP methyl ester carboxylesterase
MEASAVTWEVREIRLRRGVIRYREVGSGPDLLFVHGILGSSTLWRGVMARLQGRGESREAVFSGD